MSPEETSSSYICLPTSKVISRCNYLISQIQKQRKEADNELIDRYINMYHRKRWWQLKSKPRLKREEYVEMILEKEEGYWKNSFYPSILGWGTLAKAEKLLKAAKISKQAVKDTQDSMMYISVEDSDEIF